MAQTDKGLSEPSYAQSDKKRTDYPWWVENIDKHLVPRVSLSDSFPCYI